MAQKTDIANPIANFYEAQAAATAEIAHAALNGLQRLQKLTLEAMRAGGQLSLAQSMAAMRDGGAGKSAAQASAPAAEQTARYQSEMVQAIADMNNEIVRASYSMMERMRDALGAAQGALSTRTVLPGLQGGGAAMANPMAMYDSAMRQWQTAVQQMMETPAVAMAVASTEDDQPLRPARTARSRKPKRAAKRKAGTHPR